MNDGDTSVEPVAVVIPGPLHVYTGVPAPVVPDVAVRVIIPPTQKGLLAEEIRPVSVGCAVTL